MARRPVDPVEHPADPALLLETAAQLLSQRMLTSLHEAGCVGLRHSDGYVFQHLVTGPLPISELARRLAMTAQGASKAVVDLERRGFVERTVDPTDERVRLAALTDLGWLAIEGARRERAALRRRLTNLLGADAAAAFVDQLGVLVEDLGGFQALRARRLVPPT